MGIEIKNNENYDLIEYVKNAMETFDKDPFNDVDALVLGNLVYTDFHEDNNICFRKKGIALRDIFKAETFDELFAQSWDTERSIYFLASCAASPRFRDTVIRYYRNELEKSINMQFGAITVSINDKLHVIVFRGTDFSFAGWKEDALLALDKPIVSQKLAAEYVNDVAKKLKGKLIIVGHSKGGNLAVYAGANCERKVQDRIQTVYSFDGPGFYENELAKDGYQRIKDRCKKFIPEFSVFGMLFQSIVKPQIIHSYGIGIMQHWAITWGVNGKEFATEKANDPISNLISTRLDNWLEKLNDEQKRVFVQGLFDVLDSMKVESIDAFATDGKKILNDVIKCINEMEPRRKRFMQYALTLMISGKSDMAKLKDIKGLDVYDMGDEIELQKYNDDFSLFI